MIDKKVNSKKPEDMITVEELSEWLKVPITTIYEWTASDKIPSYKIGKYRRFDPSEIRLWIKRRGSAA